jgi:hypothetical protein
VSVSEGPRVRSRVLRASVGAVCLLIAAMTFWRSGGHAQQASDRLPTPSGPYVLDPRIRTAGAVVGLTQTQLTQLRVQFGSNWPSDLHASAYYLTVARIIVLHPNYANADPARTGAIIAYEYMHYIWDTQRHPAGLKEWLQELRASDPVANAYLERAIAVDNGDVNQTWTEMLSIACTMTQDAHMPRDLVSYCDMQLPGRHALPQSAFPF